MYVREHGSWVAVICASFLITVVFNSYSWSVYKNVIIIFRTSQTINWLLGFLNMAIVIILYKRRIFDYFPFPYFLCFSVLVLVFQRFGMESISTAIQNRFRQTFGNMGGEKQVPEAFYFFSTPSSAVLNISLNLYNWDFIINVSIPSPENSYYYLSTHQYCLNFFTVPHYSHSLWEERCASISWRSSGSHKKWVLPISVIFSLDHQTNLTVWWLLILNHW